MDKDHKSPADTNFFRDVPKHFYANFKTNMIKDAHFMAKEMAKGEG